MKRATLNDGRRGSAWSTLGELLSSVDALYFLGGFAATAVVGGALFLALALSDRGSDSSSSPAAAAVSSPTQASARTSEAAQVPTTEPASGTATLVDVRIGVHEGFDRLVFEFADGLPGYDIERVDPPILADASGMPVEVSGDSFLQVRLSPAAAHDEAGDTTLSVSELLPDLPGIVEARQVGDFEGVVTWALGLVANLEFESLELEDPSRLVIDVKHP